MMFAIPSGGRTWFACMLVIRLVRLGAGLIVMPGELGLPMAVFHNTVSVLDAALMLDISIGKSVVSTKIG